MTDTARSDGIAKIRELADRLEQGGETTVVIAWWNPNDPFLQAMNFGNPILADALVMHMIRVRVQHGAFEGLPPETIKWS